VLLWAFIFMKDGLTINDTLNAMPRHTRLRGAGFSSHRKRPGIRLLSIQRVVLIANSETLQNLTLTPVFGMR
jgi:hypothetical protein